VCVCEDMRERLWRTLAGVGRVVARNCAGERGIGIGM